MGNSSNKKDRESNRPKPTDKNGKAPWHFPITAAVLTGFCVFFGVIAWMKWVEIEPFINALMEMQSGEPSPEMLAMFQSIDMNAMIVTLIWFIVSLAVFPNFLILSIVGWVRDW
jgi:hypothetical protein